MKNIGILVLIFMFIVPLALSLATYSNQENTVSLDKMSLLDFSNLLEEKEKGIVNEEQDLELENIPWKEDAKVDQIVETKDHIIVMFQKEGMNETFAK